MKQRIFVVDEHPLVRKGYSYLIAGEVDLEICGEAGSVADAISKIPSSRPDLVVTGLVFQGASGLELLKWLQLHMPRVPVLVVSMKDELLFGWRCLLVGARGYVLKDTNEQVIVEAIRKVVRGGLFLSERMTEQLVGNLNGSNGWSTDPLQRLTARELEVFTQCGRGLTTKEIGKALHISSKTVESHRIRIREKLGITSNSDLVRLAAQCVALEST